MTRPTRWKRLKVYGRLTVRLLTAYLGLLNWESKSALRAFLRLRALCRCLYHAFLPPFLEKAISGEVHYHPEWTWFQHCKVNLKEAWKLAAFQELSDEDREFHRL